MVEELDLEQIGEKDLNARLQALAGRGGKVILRNTHARHNIAVNVSGELTIEVQGSAGFYCCGFMNGPTVTVKGNVGWYAADNMLGGKLTVLNNAGSNLAPSMIGGAVIVRGLDFLPQRIADRHGQQCPRPRPRSGGGRVAGRTLRRERFSGRPGGVR